MATHPYIENINIRTLQALKYIKTLLCGVIADKNCFDDAVIFPYGAKIIFTKGGGQWIEKQIESGADALGLDWQTDIGVAKPKAQGHAMIRTAIALTNAYT